MRRVDDLGIAHAGKRDDRHIHRVEEANRWTAQQPVTGDADGQNDEKTDEGYSELTAELHLRPGGGRGK
jgi:hypothetical protein